MRRPQDIAVEEATMGTMLTLTTAFEGIASMRISRIKNQVLQAQDFFEELWKMYNQLRVDKLFRFGRQQADAVVDKELLIAVTAEGGFSGDIDQKLITWMLKDYNPKLQDIIIIGHHGAVQLTQAGVQFKKYYKLPSKDQNINVTPLVRQVRDYRTTTMYYQSYVSLMVQDIKRMEIRKAVQQAGSRVGQNEEVISNATYIFEPSNFAVVAHLERSMVEVTLSQAILESKLAQYASRFRAMSVSKTRATDMHDDLHLLYNQTKRAMADERLKEIINGVKKVGT
jgi:ATP synthase F1 gamma subunit